MTERDFTLGSQPYDPPPGDLWPDPIRGQQTHRVELTDLGRTAKRLEHTRRLQTILAERAASVDLCAFQQLEAEHRRATAVASDLFQVLAADKAKRIAHHERVAHVLRIEKRPAWREEALVETRMAIEALDSAIERNSAELARLQAEGTEAGQLVERCRSYLRELGILGTPQERLRTVADAVSEEGE